MYIARAVQKYKRVYGIRVLFVSRCSCLRSSHCRISLAAPVDKADHIPARTLALDPPPLDPLHRKHLESCPELLRLLLFPARRPAAPSPSPTRAAVLSFSRLVFVSIDKQDYWKQRLGML